MYVFENLRVYGETEKEMIEANVIWVGLVIGSPRTILKNRSGVSDFTKRWRKGFHEW